MDHFINKEFVLRRIQDTPPIGDVGKVTLQQVYADIQSITPADVRENKHGRWIGENGETVGIDANGFVEDTATCSECGAWLVASDEYWVKGRFCPDCGADMRG